MILHGTDIKWYISKHVYYIIDIAHWDRLSRQCNFKMDTMYGSIKFTLVYKYIQQVYLQTSTLI